MKKFIRNEEDGKFLFIESHKKDETFEDRMIKTMSNENILTPSIVYEQKKRQYCFCITGLRPVKEYLHNRELSKNEIGNLIFQLNSIVELTASFMLSEKNLVPDPDAVFIREETGKLIFCIVGEEIKESFSNGIRKLMEELISHIDERDAEAVNMGFCVFRICRRPEFHMYDIMDAVWKNRLKDGTLKTENTEEKRDDSFRQEVIEKEISDGEEIPFEDQFIEELPEKSIVSKHIIKFLISVGIMILAIVVVFIIKGIGTVKKIIPFFIIIIISLIIYTFIEIIREKKNQQVISET